MILIGANCPHVRIELLELRYRLGVYFIVFIMCPDELDEGSLPSKVECHDHPITAARDLETHALAVGSPRSLCDIDPGVVVEIADGLVLAPKMGA